MAYTIEQLRSALTALEAARHDSARRCGVSRVDREGKKTRVVHKPRAKRGPSSIELPLGNHGVSYLTIDLETGEIACGACAGHVDSTVAEEAIL